MNAMTAHKPPPSDPVRDALEPLEEDERSELTATWATVRDDSMWPGIDADRRDRVGAFLSAHVRAEPRESQEGRIQARPLLRLVRRRWVVLSAATAAVVVMIAIGLALQLHLVEIAAPPDQARTEVLSDVSSIELHPGAVLVYGSLNGNGTANFTTEREVSFFRTYCDGQLVSSGYVATGACGP